MFGLGSIGNGIGNLYDTVSNGVGAGLDSLDRSNNEFRDVNAQAFKLPEYQHMNDRQNRLNDMLEQQAMGQGPSLANMQMQRGLQSALAQQQAMAQSGRGNPAMAARQAAINSGNIAQNLAGQGAMARVAEQRSAQQALTGGLQGQLNINRAQQQGNQAYQDARTNRFNSMLNQPTNSERLVNMVSDVGSMFG